MHHLLAAKEDELSSAAMGVLVLVGLPRPDRARSDDADDATAAARNRAGKRVGGKKEVGSDAGCAHAGRFTAWRRRCR